MKISEWITLFLVVGFGLVLANFIGFHVGILESLPGMGVLLVISLVAVVLDKLIAIKLPVIAYCSLVGLLVASPISPIREFVISSVGRINFTAPLTMVGAFAGMSISNQLKVFAKQGWKMVIITVVVMTGTYVGSLLIAQLVLSLTHAI
ncbi:hypothetical protein [Sphaerochaeta sp.]|uniref:hypothetical protein n=1 Tax=Sphaerochaeta sp. TaxID=1972642 RepID=UPI002FC81E8C